MSSGEELRFGRRGRPSQGPRIRVLAALLAVAAAMAWVMHHKETRSPPLVQGGDVIVEVRGEVASPGFHVVHPPVTVARAVMAAGGAALPKDTRVVAPGSRVTVQGDAAVVAPLSDTLVVGVPVDLNTATASALDALPGVGPTRAAAIVTEREVNGPFGSVDELARVEGIGAATVAKLRPFVVVAESL